MMIETTNPATGRTGMKFPEHDEVTVDQAIDLAVRCQREWRSTALDERAALLHRLGAVLRAEAGIYARLITEEMGKPLGEALAEVEKCALNCDFYAARGAEFLGSETIALEGTTAELRFEPLGVILAIMPWNYPLWQFFRFMAPALIAGNVALLKHANNVPQCALAIEGIFEKAGATRGLVQTLLIASDRVAGVIGDDRVAAVTMTGSTEVGALVAAQAGRHIKKQVLELGGSDPFIVLADAEVPRAAAAAVRARFTNAGQSCVNAKRFIVIESVADRFVDEFCRLVNELKVGDPMEPGVEIGPMARKDLVAKVHSQVERSLAAGAALRCGGAPLNRQGYFFEPTVLDHVTSEMPAFVEETFGPVAAVVRARNEDEAVELANRTEYGLGASIWTGDLATARRMIPRIDAGTVFVNAVVASQPAVPFGGIKRSGYGRELGSYGLREFVNVKTVQIQS